jgi:hypothetical protein
MHDIENILTEIECKDDFIGGFCLCENDHELLMERLFLSVQNCGETKKMWLNEDILEKVFASTNTVSLWRVASELLSPQVHSIS